MPRMALSGVLLLLALTSVASAEQYILRLERVIPAGGWARLFSKEPPPAHVLELLVESEVPFDVEALFGDESLGCRGVVTVDPDADEQIHVSLTAEATRRVGPLSRSREGEVELPRDRIAVKAKWTSDLAAANELPDLKLFRWNAKKGQALPAKSPGESWRVSVRPLKADDLPEYVRDLNRRKQKDSSKVVLAGATDSRHAPYCIRFSEVGWPDTPEEQWDKRPPGTDLFVVRIVAAPGDLFYARMLVGPTEFTAGGNLEACVETDAAAVYPMNVYVRHVDYSGTQIPLPEEAESRQMSSQGASTRIALSPKQPMALGGIESSREIEIKGKPAKVRSASQFKVRLLPIDD